MRQTRGRKMSRSTSRGRSRTPRTIKAGVYTPKKKTRRSSSVRKNLWPAAPAIVSHQDGTGTSVSKAIIGRKSKKNSIYSKILKWETPVQLSENIASLIVDTGNAALQKAACFVPVTTGTDIQNMFNITNYVTPSLAGSSYLPKYGSGQKAFKIFLDYSLLTTTMTNMTTSNITVDIYDLDCKRDRSTPSATQPTLDWDNGQYYDEAGNQTLTASSTAPYTTPNNSMLFLQNYKIVRKHHIELAQGRSHEHTHLHKFDKIINTEVSATNQHLKGLTTFVMVVVRGLPAIETSSVTATLARAKIACVSRLKYKYRIHSVMPTIFAEAGVLYGGSTINVVSEGAGVVATEQIG